MAEVVPLVNCYCYRDDVRKKRRLLLSTPGMQSSASMLVSIAVWYTGPTVRIAVPQQVHILYVPLESVGNIPNGCVAVTRPSRLSVEGMRAPD